MQFLRIYAPCRGEEVENLRQFSRLRMVRTLAEWRSSFDSQELRPGPGVLSVSSGPGLTTPLSGSLSSQTHTTGSGTRMTILSSTPKNAIVSSLSLQGELLMPVDRS